MKDLAGLLNQSNLNTLTFQLIDLYQEVLSLPEKLKNPQNTDYLTSKTKTKNVFYGVILGIFIKKIKKNC